MKNAEAENSRAASAAHFPGRNASPLPVEEGTSSAVEEKPVLRRFRADFHVHSVLSPCAELEMGAPEIVRRAAEEGIVLLALTDHNATANVPALMEAAEAQRRERESSDPGGDGVPHILCGAEVQTEEDIHVVGLFRSVEEGLSFQKWLWKHLPPRANDPGIFGYQLVLDGENSVIEEVETLLVQGVACSLENVLAEIRRRGGLSFLAHVDRPVFSYVAVFGPVPEGLPVDAVELSRRLSREEASAWRDRLGTRTVLRSSDAHRLDDLRREHCMELLLAEPTFDEVVLALRNEKGRRVLWPWGEDAPP